MENQPSHRRYRRRILALGVVAFLVLFVVGAMIFIPVVQNDLTDRVERSLADDGIVGVSASFSGQDGTLTCTTPLADPDAVEAAAEDLWGVRSIDLDPSCRADDAGRAGEPETSPPATDPTRDSTLAQGPAATEPGPEAILDIVDGDQLFGQLAAWLRTAQLTGLDGLGGDGPYTLFAPTPAAFDAIFDDIGADGFEDLGSDADLLRTILLHHVAEGEITSSDLESGALTMLDGTEIVVDVDALTFTSGSSVAGVEDPSTQLDIEASNGVIHAIDRLLIPAGLELADPNDGTTRADFTDGRLVLSGDLQSETQRQQLVNAAQQVVEAGNVEDQLVVNSSVVVDDAEIGRLAGLVAGMPPNLVSGTVVLVGDQLSLTGVYRDDGTNATLTALAGALGAGTDLTARNAADDTTAQALQDELNEFVRRNPILFEPNSTTLTADAAAVIEQLAARALRLAGTSILIVGHTDSDGDAAANQRLSEGRAAAVLNALVEQGLAADSLQSEGRGAQNPVLGPDGVEDKSASRRVEFIVTAI